MAPPTVPINQKGTALLEAISVVSLLLTLTLGVLTVSYLLFARAWLSYTSEQALYCLAENKPLPQCRNVLRTQLKRFLPWGTVEEMNLIASPQVWTVELKWKWNQLRQQTKRRLSVRDIVKKRGLRW